MTYNAVEVLAALISRALDDTEFDGHSETYKDEMRQGARAAIHFYESGDYDAEKLPLVLAKAIDDTDESDFFDDSILFGPAYRVEYMKTAGEVNFFLTQMGPHE